MAESKKKSTKKVTPKKEVSSKSKKKKKSKKIDSTVILTIIFCLLLGLVVALSVVVIKNKLDHKDDIKAKMDEYMNSRKEKQPYEYPNAGSTFKRKGEIITAKLIDECGLKGLSVGDASVSEKHAGFIINKGKATATDILELIEIIKKEVKEKKGIEIELEVLVLGEK